MRPIELAAVLLLVLPAVPGGAAGRVVCDLGDEAVIGGFTSGDSEVAVAEGPTAGSKALGLVFRPVNDWPSARYELPAPQDWSQASVLSVVLRNDSAATATIEVGVVDAAGKAYKPARRLAPGVWTTVHLPVTAMSAGTDAGAWCGEAIDVTRVTRVWLLAYSPVEPLPVRCADLRLLTLPRLPAPVVSAQGAGDGVALTWEAVAEASAYDVYRREPGEGRRAVRLARFPVPRFVDISARPGVAYEYRVAALDELGRPGARSRPVRGAAARGAQPALPRLSRYGGRKDAKLAASGFFRVEKVQGRWVLVDPEGHPMLSVGLCVISLGDSYTRVTRREQLFADVLAERTDPRFKAAWDPPYGYEAYGLAADSGLVFSRYVRGLIVKHGPDWRRRWQEDTIRRLDDWRVNTAAAWSAADLGRPYVSFSAGWGDTPKIPTPEGHLNVPDVFDPAFERNVEQSAAAAAALRGDPWLIGWFTANEMGWYGDWEHGLNLVNCVNTAAPELAAKRAWVEFLRGRYTATTALNAAWGTAFTGWEALLASRAKLPTAPRVRADASAFLEAFADRYFRLTAGALRRHDPHHLLLGARHSQGAPAEVIRAESRYNDVVSATIYGLSPRRPVLSGGCDTEKPWLAGEFHFQARDAGLPLRAVEGIYATQAERGEAYQNYLADGFALPGFIGAHWFEYIDEPATGRFDGGKDGGEAFNIGWVNVADEPYEAFVERARLSNANLPLLIAP